MSYKWTCHLHPNNDCQMTIIDNRQYHILPVKETTAYAQTNFNDSVAFASSVIGGEDALNAKEFNYSDNIKEFRECLNQTTFTSPLQNNAPIDGSAFASASSTNTINTYPTIFITPIANCSSVYQYQTFVSILQICKVLDDESLIFSNYTKPSDFLKKHIITDGISKITLCNKHLLKKIYKKNSKPKYLSHCWIKQLLKYLFPNINSGKNLPTNTPDWAIELYKSLVTSSNCNKNSTTNVNNSRIGPPLT